MLMNIFDCFDDSHLKFWLPPYRQPLSCSVRPACAEIKRVLRIFETSLLIFNESFRPPVHDKLEKAAALILLITPPAIEVLKKVHNNTYKQIRD